MFQLSPLEAKVLRSQIVTSNGESDATSKDGRGGRRYLPLAFTEQGIAMLSSVLNSERAIQVNIAIMRVFVELRKAFAIHENLARKILDMEQKYDNKFDLIFVILENWDENSPDEDKPPMGFVAK